MGQDSGRDGQLPPSHDGPFFDVVVVGASAGGVRAVETLLEALPRPLPVALTVVIHLSPAYQSLLAEILTRATGRSVEWAVDGAALRPGGVYVAPPDRHLVLTPRGLVSLTTTPREHFARPSVDQLFTSAAQTYGNRVVAVVLTGTGSDGTTGALAVRRAGGVVIAQDEESSEYFSMPHMVIAAGAATSVLPLLSIAAEVVRLVLHGRAPMAPRTPLTPNVKFRSSTERLPPAAADEPRSPGS